MAPTIIVRSPQEAMSNRALYIGCNTEEDRMQRFYQITGRLVQLGDGTQAYTHGTWPQQATKGYKYPPTSHPLYEFDATTPVTNAMGLGDFNEAILPVFIAWIDDIRMLIPYPDELNPMALMEDGQPVFGINGEILRDIRILPRYISSAVEGWRLQYWFTVDSRIMWSDIIARMHFQCSTLGGQGPLAGGTDAVIAALNARIEGFRRSHNILAPIDGAFDPNTYQVTQADIEAVLRLSEDQLKYGTWWDVDVHKGVMYAPRPLDPNIPYTRVQYILPPKLGLSPRVRMILEVSQGKFPLRQMQGAPQTFMGSLSNGAMTQSSSMSPAHTTAESTNHVSMTPMMQNVENGLAYTGMMTPMHSTTDFLGPVLTTSTIGPFAEVTAGISMISPMATPSPVISSGSTSEE